MRRPGYATVLPSQSAIVWLTTRLFYKEKGATIIPTNPVVSDDEEAYDDNDDVADPTFIPTTHDLDTPGPNQLGPSSRRTVSATSAMEFRQDEDDKDNEEEEEAAKPQSKKPRRSKARTTTWKKVDINNPPFPEYVHTPSEYIQSPFQYFSKFFSKQVLECMTYQTNLNATQRHQHHLQYHII
ncbi:hypothetical protein O3P69_006454 [Scylla paramamosain]|uniref:PiggyBac transposable element-derived protein domain-containing protein n=1 Tax=Scylla paramamosain TaxID=85552 RepID=A0AAW0U4P4_SCYPA